jgi:hypothetical protein
MASVAAWENMTDCMAATVPDLSALVAVKNSNSGEPREGARWLVKIAADAFGGHPIAGYDLGSHDFEMIERKLLPPFRIMLADLPDAQNALPDIADFLVRRLPSIWSRDYIKPCDAPVTKALVMAERIHDIAAAFATNRRPTGSKDPYAIRRAALELLAQVVCEFTTTAGFMRHVLTTPDKAKSED